MLRWNQNLLIIMSTSSKMLNCSSSGHSNKSRFIVIDWKLLLKRFSTERLSSKNLLLLIRISTSFLVCLLEKYGLQVDQNDLNN